MLLYFWSKVFFLAILSDEFVAQLDHNFRRAFAEHMDLVWETRVADSGGRSFARRAKRNQKFIKAVCFLVLHQYLGINF